MAKGMPSAVRSGYGMGGLRSPIVSDDEGVGCVGEDVYHSPLALIAEHSTYARSGSHTISRL